MALMVVGVILVGLLGAAALEYFSVPHYPPPEVTLDVTTCHLLIPSPSPQSVATQFGSNGSMALQVNVSAPTSIYAYSCSYAYEKVVQRTQVGTRVDVSYTFKLNFSLSTAVNNNFADQNITVISPVRNGYFPFGVSFVYLNSQQLITWYENSNDTVLTVPLPSSVVEHAGFFQLQINSTTGSIP
jgi:hypothetical protein